MARLQLSSTPVDWQAGEEKEEEEEEKDDDDEDDVVGTRMLPADPTRPAHTNSSIRNETTSRLVRF